MSFDNVQFNVNGIKDDDLFKCLELAFGLHAPSGCAGFIKDDEKGLILLWYTGADKESQSFPIKLSVEEIFPIIKVYLKSEEADLVKLEDWDRNQDHDGHNEKGWRVYCEDWGHVKTHYSICAIKRSYIWYGK